LIGIGLDLYKEIQIKKIAMKNLLLILTIFFGLNTLANAQATASANHNVNLNLTNAIEISFTTGGSGVTMAFSTADHYNDGVEATNAATIRVRSNKGYNVTVKSGSVNFSSAAVTTMPVSGVLHIKEANQSNYTGLTNQDQNLVVNQNRGINSIDISYKATPGFNFDAGTYMVSVVFTATQN
jgi:hypothetical protein